MRVSVVSASVSICLLLLLAPVGAGAQDCPAVSTSGYFEVAFDGAVYDGSSTKFTYCVTGLDEPGFHGLSHWDLSFSEECIDAGNLTGCGPEPCFYQVEDPTTGITGIKWDDLDLDKGQTACYDFSLEGDWTGLVGSVTYATKSAQDIFYGDICGPVCEGCGASLKVLQSDGGEPLLSVSVIHNRPPVVNATVFYQLLDQYKQVVHEWTDGPVTFELGQAYRVLGPIPDLPPLTPGIYNLRMRIQGMSGWVTRRTTFRVD